MKQIFDWLREQINAKIVKSPTNNEDWFRDECVRNNAYQNALDFINEAEAKWEKDCCIRVVGKPFTSSCGQKWDKWTDVGEPYCSKCGKPIKIVEVE